MLERFGEHIRRFSLIGHVRHFEIRTIVEHCRQIDQLHLLRSTKLHPKELGKIVDQMKNLKHIDILWTSNEHDILWSGGCDIASLIRISSNLKELTIRIPSNRQCIHTFSKVSPSSWIEEWADQYFLPQRLNIVTNVCLIATDAIKRWQQLNSNSPTEYTSILKIYSSCKTPANSPPTLPVLQLEFGQSCTLPIILSNPAIMAF